MLKEVRSDDNYLETPIVIFTTSDSPMDKKKAQELRADAYFSLFTIRLQIKKNNLNENIFSSFCYFFYSSIFIH